MSPQVRILYVRNLMLSTDETTMRTAFERVTPGCIEKVKKIKDFGFVHFTTRDAAEVARKAMNEAVLDGAVLEVIWAKPPDRTIMKYVRSSIKSGQPMPTTATGAGMSMMPSLVPGAFANATMATAAAAALYAAPPPQHQQAVNANDWAFLGSPLIDTSQTGGNRMSNTVNSANLLGAGVSKGLNSMGGVSAQAE